MENVLLLKKINHILYQNIINEINQVGIVKQFLKHDINIDINQTIDYISLLLSGNIKILRENNNGDDLLIYFLEAGETHTMLLTCVMGTYISKIRAVAEKKSSLILIPVKSIQNWFRKGHSWRNFILES